MDLGNDDFIRQSKSDHINDILVRHAVRHLLGPYHRGQQNEQQGGELFQRDLLGGEWIVQECVENYSFDARNRARTIAGGPRSNRVVSDVSLNKDGYAGPRGIDVGGGVLAKRMSVRPAGEVVVKTTARIAGIVAAASQSESDKDRRPSSECGG